MIRISGDPSGEAADAFAHMLRLQNDFYARLTEETLNYLRKLQGVLGPAAPGTVLVPGPDDALAESACPGDHVQLKLEVTNDQPVHCVATPALTVLVSASGVTWFPAAQTQPAYLLIPPGRTEAAAIELAVPAQLPPGVYRGVMLLHGSPHELPVAITIEDVPPEPAAAKVALRRAKPPRRSAPAPLRATPAAAPPGQEAGR
jgi:hypothetical protein